MLTINEISVFMNTDRNYLKKKLARQGNDYYNGNHDIKNSKIFYYDALGNLVEDKYKSNIKISHNFFGELCDQQVQYMLSNKDSIIKSDDVNFQKELDKYFGDDFKEELQSLLTGTITKGYEYMYAYKEEDKRTRFITADSLGVIEVRAKDTNDNCDYIIYWYVDRIEKNTKEIVRIQVWDDEKTYYYVQEYNGKIELDLDQPLNPRPHIIYTKENDDKIYYDSLGYMPFFRLDNNNQQVSGLKPIKALIDDYDLMSCGLSNNIQDTNESLYVVSGYQGMDMSDLMHNLKSKKIVGVGDGGNVDIKTVNIPYQARQVKLELDEKNIYRFGMGFNSTQLGDGNITNIVIKSRYALLDLKCNKLEIRLRRFLRKLISIVVDEINQMNNTMYDEHDVYFDFTREVMTNAQDNATIEKTYAEIQQIQVNTLLNVANTIGNDNILKSLCDVLELDYEEIQEQIEQDKQASLENAQSLLDGVVVE